MRRSTKTRREAGGAELKRLVSLDALVRQCKKVLTAKSSDGGTKLAAVEQLRKIAETSLKMTPEKANREQILKTYTNTEIIEEYKRRGLVVVIHVVDDRTDYEGAQPCPAAPAVEQGELPAE